MERNGDPGQESQDEPRAVSSLRARFENVGIQRRTEVSNTRTSTTSNTLQPIDPLRPPTRVSLDLPRPTSPWTPQTDTQNDHTPKSSGRGTESPTRLGHKRPMSMIVSTPPSLNPTFQVDSPRSPPQPVFMRALSGSPERGGTPDVRGTPNSITPARSKRNSPLPSPAGEKPNPTEIQPVSSSAIANPSQPRPKSPIPPAINRAEKPKVPPKLQISSSIPATNMSLDQESSRIQARKVSPFNTPPDSDDEDGAESGTRSVRQQPVERASRVPASNIVDKSSTDITTSLDPRMMGFAAQPKTYEVRDPRNLGFASARPPREEPGQTPMPSQVEPGRSRSMRDARDFGFDRTATSRESPERQGPVKPSPPRHELPERATSVRDPRFMGFGNVPSSPATPTQYSKPELPRRAPQPPPRPSEESKRPVYAPGITHTQPTIRQVPAETVSERPAPQTSARRPSTQMQEATAKVIPANAQNFLPPPKRIPTLETSPSKMDSPVHAPSTPIEPRRPSVDTRPRIQTPVITRNASPRRMADDSDEAEEGVTEPASNISSYPDSTRSNRRPPVFDSSARRQMNIRSDGRVIDICGQWLAVGGYHTRVFDISTGREMLDMSHGETTKITSLIFKPGSTIDDEGKRLWIGSDLGVLQEIDLITHVTIAESSVHGRREISRMFRHQSDLWTLDEDGKLCVWQPNETGTPNMKSTPLSYRIPRNFTYAMIAGDKLWVVYGKEIRVYHPGHQDFELLSKPLTCAADVSCGACSPTTNQVYLGHIEGSVSVFSTGPNFACLSTIKISSYKLNGMSFVGSDMWVVYKTGKVYVYEVTATTPWKVKKDWRALDGMASGIVIDPRSVWSLGCVQVAVTGHDQYVRLYDGMLEDDWVENYLQNHSEEYCAFRTTRAAVTTWNCGAVTPLSLRTDFVADAVHASYPDPPEILVFGFQEVVDLEDKSLTAKSILKFKKDKHLSSTSEHHQSRVYREWRDYLAKSLARYMPGEHYSEVHMSSLVGLFQCIFVKSSEKRSLTSYASAPVKTGMGGHYGNKGGLLARFALDDTSLCFVNCHLAAGQTNTAQRNNDIAAILESEVLPQERNTEGQANLYIGGGDGRQILDHEVVLLNGDLNYRIEGTSRDAVVKHITNNNLSVLLEKDQINRSRQRIAGFRLATFTELPITFAPTYKYDVGTDDYDSSDKKRSPAWCDRIMYRALKGRVRQLEYRRHEDVRCSDHRPVSAVFDIKIKKVDPEKRRICRKQAYREFERVKSRIIEDGRARYLVDYFGVDEREARKYAAGMSTS